MISLAFGLPLKCIDVDNICYSKPSSMKFILFFAFLIDFELNSNVRVVENENNENEMKSTTN